MSTRPWTAWLLSSGLALLCATFGVTAAEAQQVSTVSVSARVIRVDPLLSYETLGRLLEGLPDRVPGPGVRRGTETTIRSRRAQLRAGSSLVSAARECPERDSEACLAVVTVQFLEN